MGRIASQRRARSRWRLRAALALAIVGCLPAAAAARAETPVLAPVGNFAAPTYVTAPPGDVHRVFVVERRGTIQVLRDGVRASQPFLALPDVETGYVERGLLSMAFAPDYATSGRFYVYYVTTQPLGNLVIAEYRRSAANPDLADPASRRVLLSIPHPTFPNHNGGQLQFGPDGFLYIGTGDGGSGGDPPRNAQNLDVLLGKILRIDPLHPPKGAAYAIPTGNPFADQTDKRPEIWQYGLRNPWRFSFDRATGDQWIGDVGQDKWEEVDFVPHGGGRGANFQWNTCEGKHAYVKGGTENGCPTGTPGLAPVYDYGHTGRCSITGGYVVRDRSLDSLWGSYLFGDYCGGQVYARSSDGAVHDLAPLNVPQLASFGEDACGHVYAASQGGAVSRLQTSSTGPCVDATAPGNPAVRIDHRPVHVSGSGALRLRLPCPTTAAGQCFGSVVLRRGSVILARGAFSTARGRLATPRLRLSARGRALLRHRHRHRLPVQVVVRSRDASGHSARTTARVTLRA